VASEAEAEVWGALCARGFSHRPGDPSRFYRKLRADPTARLEWIRVVVSEDGRLVGSVRVFDRAISLGEGVDPVRMAGLGEVCTDPDYRGRGISTVMLVDAVQFCEVRTGAVVSLLHAAAAVAPLYQRFGYRPLQVHYGRMLVDPSNTTDGIGVGVGRAWLSRQAHLDDDREVATLAAMHEDTCNALRAVGWTRRDDAYWRRWIAHTSLGRLVVAVLRPPALQPVMAAAAGSDAGDDGRPLLYACIQRKPEGYKVMDFGWSGWGSDVATVGHHLPTSPLDALYVMAAQAMAHDIAAGHVAVGEGWEGPPRAPRHTATAASAPAPASTVSPSPSSSPVLPMAALSLHDAASPVAPALTAHPPAHVAAPSGEDESSPLVGGVPLLVPALLLQALVRRGGLAVSRVVGLDVHGGLPGKPGWTDAGWIVRPLHGSGGHVPHAALRVAGHAHESASASGGAREEGSAGGDATAATVWRDAAASGGSMLRGDSDGAVVGGNGVSDDTPQSCINVPTAAGVERGEAAAKALMDASDEGRFLVWPLDAF